MGDTTRLCDEDKHAACARLGSEVSTIVQTGPTTVRWGDPVPCGCSCGHERTTDGNYISELSRSRGVQGADQSEAGSLPLPLEALS